MNIGYTPEELSAIRLDQLQNICHYFGVHITKSNTKKEVIEKLMGFFYPDGYLSKKDPPTSPVSSRVLRIRERMRENE